MPPPILLFSLPCVSADQPAAGGIRLVKLKQLHFAVNIGLIDAFRPTAAGIAAAAAAFAAAAAGIQRLTDDLLPLFAGGITNQQGTHVYASSQPAIFSMFSIRIP